MTRDIPRAITADQVFYATIIEQNEEIIALLKRTAPTEETASADNGEAKLTGL